MRALYPGGIGIWRWWFLCREVYLNTRRKTLWARREPITNSNQNRNRATLVGDKHSPAPLHHPCSSRREKLILLQGSNVIQFPRGFKFWNNQSSYTTDFEFTLGNCFFIKFTWWYLAVKEVILFLVISVSHISASLGRLAYQDLIGYVRYVNILTWLRGSRLKIVNYFIFF